MQNFVKFLIDENAIDKGQLVEACLFQEQNAYGLIQVLREHELIDDNKISQLILDSMSSGEHLYNLLCTHDPAVAKKAMDELQKTTPSFTSVLIERGYLERDELERLYTEYEKSFEKDNAESESGDVSGTETLSEAALESLRELGMDTSELEASSSQAPAGDDGPIENESLEVEQEDFEIEYLNFFNEARRDDMIALLASLEEVSNKGDIQNELNGLFNDFHLLKGAARLDDLKLSEKLIDQSEQLTCFIMEAHEHTGDIFTHYKSTFDNAISTVWDLRQTILNNGSETQFWKDEQNKSRYIQLMKDLKYHAVAA